MYGSIMIANNVLSRSFSDEILISHNDLQEALHLTSKWYRKVTHNRLLREEPFSFSDSYFSYTIYDKFRELNNSLIDLYIRDGKGNVLIVNETEVVHGFSDIDTNIVVKPKS